MSAEESLKSFPSRIDPAPVAQFQLPTSLGIHATRRLSKTSLKSQNSTQRPMCPSPEGFSCTRRTVSDVHGAPLLIGNEFSSLAVAPTALTHGLTERMDGLLGLTDGPPAPLGCSSAFVNDLPILSRGSPGPSSHSPALTKASLGVTKGLSALTNRLPGLTKAASSTMSNLLKKRGITDSNHIPNHPVSDSTPIMHSCPISIINWEMEHCPKKLKGGITEWKNWTRRFRIPTCCFQHAGSMQRMETLKG